jgi:hypothetical protein
MAKPIIKTSCWFTKLPEGHCRIGISRGLPRGQKRYHRYTKLNPGAWFHSVDPKQYKTLYYQEVLKPLCAQRVVDELVEIADGEVPVLLCWQKAVLPSSALCHRGLVSAWLDERLGLKVYEHGLEAFGCGWRHPMLHPEIRKAIS